MRGIFAVTAALCGALAGSARAGITDTWFPIPASNHFLLHEHRDYARLLWSFDYGHALIYENLWKSALTGNYDFCLIEEKPECETIPPQTILQLVQAIVAKPPLSAPAEESLSPSFTTDFSWLMDMFSWTHRLHWVSYDVLGAEPLERAKAIMKVQLEQAYRKHPTLALPTQCKSMMALMEGQKFSMRFRTNAPASNGLIWAYHYYQLALYEGLLLPKGPARDRKLAEVMKTFRWMAEDPANRVPKMPMAKTVAPNFYREFRDLAAIFDNLHEVHDVIGDLLSSTDEVYGTPARKKAEMSRVMREVLDDHTYVIDCDKNGHEN